MPDPEGYGKGVCWIYQVVPKNKIVAGFHCIIITVVKRRAPLYGLQGITAPPILRKLFPDLT